MEGQSGRWKASQEALHVPPISLKQSVEMGETLWNEHWGGGGAARRQGALYSAISSVGHRVSACANDLIWKPKRQPQSHLLLPFYPWLVAVV